VLQVQTGDALAGPVLAEVAVAKARTADAVREHHQRHRLRCAGDEQADVAFERLRRATEGYAFPQVGRITVSIGFTLVRPTDNPSSAFERADKAVYWAKSHGRNRVGNHDGLVAQGELKEDERGGDVELF
jgi:GGDEF domain-containing protein